jgi:hypothetical protein
VQRNRVLDAFLTSLVWALLVPFAHGEKRALLIGVAHYLPPPGSAIPIQPGHALDSRFAPGYTWPSLHAPLQDVGDVAVMLEQKYGFLPVNIVTLPESQATHQGILDALDKLAVQTKPGDLVVFYYSGHGSQRLDTLSNKNQRDQTIVPVDAWNKDEDVRDVELAEKFNTIIYDRKAHLTAIFDSCDSATQARGVTESVARVLAYDDNDVAAERRASPHPAMVPVESDLKRLPQAGDAIIVAAAGAEETAAERRYDEDGLWHADFTHALIRVLSASEQPLSASDAVFAASNLLHAGGIPQQPSLEGHSDWALFGDPVPPHPLRARLATVADPAKPGSTWTLDVGSSGGFDVGSQFTALNVGAQDTTLLEVTRIDGPLTSTVRIVSGPPPKEAGIVFHLSKQRYPASAQLRLFVSEPDSNDPSATAESVKKMFPALRWVADPAITTIDYLVVREVNGWRAYNNKGEALAPGATPAGSAFLVLPPPAGLLNQLKLHQPYINGSYTVTTKLLEANYILAVRDAASEQPAIALFDPIVLMPRSKPFVISPEDDADDVALNDGKAPEVACRNDVSLPVRTAWLHDKAGPGDGTGLSLAITRRLVRIGKLRVWLTNAALAPPMQSWPYHLAAIRSGADTPIGTLPLKDGGVYDLRLVAAGGDIHPLAPKYLYLIGYDCAANAGVLYPDPAHTGDDKLPAQPKPSVLLKSECVTAPFGADTVFMLATPQKNPDPRALIDDGNLSQNESYGSPANAYQDMNTFIASVAASSGAHQEMQDWTIQQIVIPSSPGTDTRSASCPQ